MVLIILINHISECLSIQGRRSVEAQSRWKNNKLIRKVKSIKEKRSAITRTKMEKIHTEQMLHRYVCST